MSNALARSAPATLQLTTQRATDMLLVLQEESEVRALVRQFVKEQMVEGTDYGVIPGTKTPTLLKPGAEKLFDLFRCKPEYEVMVRTVDIASGLYSFELRCKAVGRGSGTVINEGLGSASSYESRYRYRNGERLCPACSKPTIIKGKAEYGGGWVCFAKKGGCGAKYADNAPEIAEQQVGKVTNPDLADVANTVLKIAKKRAQVDCAIGLARVSDLFTQDLDDLPTVTVAEHPAPTAAAKLVQAVTEAPAQPEGIDPGFDPPAMTREVVPEVVPSKPLSPLDAILARISQAKTRGALLVIGNDLKKLSSADQGVAMTAYRAKQGEMA